MVNVLPLDVLCCVGIDGADGAEATYGAEATDGSSLLTVSLSVFITFNAGTFNADRAF
jgi:hypothetical protein